MSEQLPSKKAASLYGVTNDYIARLCRTGKIRGSLENRTWMVDQASLAEFFSTRRELVVPPPVFPSAPALSTPVPLVVVKKVPPARVPSFPQLVPHKKFTFVAGLFALVVLLNAVLFVGASMQVPQPAAVAQVESPFFSGNIFSKILSFFFPPSHEEPRFATAPIYQANAYPTASSTTSPSHTIVNNTYPVIERIVTTSANGNWITTDTLTLMLGDIQRSLRGEIGRSISQLLDLDFFSSTNSGGGGITTITDADVPDTITVSNYLPLAGGTLSGTLFGIDATFSGTASTSILVLSGVANCSEALETNALGQIVCGTDVTSIGGGTFPFSSHAWGNSTSTTIGFTQGLISNASSTFTSTLFLSSLTNAGLAVNSTGQVYAAGTTTFSGGLTYLNGNVTNSGVTSLTAGTGIALSGSTGAITVTNTIGFPFTQTTFNGTNANATSTLIGFTNGIYTTNASTTNLSANTLAVGSTGTTSISTTGALTIQTLNGILKATNGLVSAATPGTDYLTASSLTGAFPFTAQLWGNSTSTTIGFTQGLISNASSTFTSTLFLSSLTNAGLAVNSTGQVYAAATTTYSGALTYANGNVTCNTASGSQAGCLSSTDWTHFNNKVSSSSLASSLTTAFPFTPTTFGSTNANATSTLIGFTNGIYSLASSTIGNGTQAGGLTISGGATTTKSLVLSGNRTYSGPSSAANSFLFMPGSALFGTASAAPNGIISPFNIYISGDTVDTTTDGTGNLIGFSVEHAVGNAHTGGREAFQSYLALVGTPSVAPGSAGYVGGQFMARGSANLTGTSGSYANYAGGIFAANPNVYLTSGATFYKTVNASEFDVTVPTGASTADKYGISIIKGSDDAVRGVYDDSAISINDQDNSSTLGWKYGLSFGSYAHQWAFATDSTLIMAQTRQVGPASKSVALNGVDFRNVLFSTGGYAFASPGFGVTNIGNVGVGTTTPYAKLSIHASSTETFTTLFSVASSTASATSTLFSVSNTGSSFLLGTASSTGLIVSNLNAAACDVKADTQGNLSCGTDATGAGGAFPFTQTTFGSTNANATSTLIGFTNGIYSLASSTIGNGTQTGGLTISGGATTTGFLTVQTNGSIIGSGNSGIGLSVNAGSFRSFRSGQGDLTISHSNLVSSVTAASGVQLALGAGGSEWARLSLTGNLGLSSTSPTYKLSVEGESSLGNSATAGRFIATTSVASVFPFASTTGITVSGTASTTALIVSGLNAAACDVKADTQGNLSCGTDATGAGGAFPFTQTTFGATNANATSTLIGFTQGLYALASSTIGDGTQTGGLTISGNSTTTGNAYVNGYLNVATSTGYLINGVAALQGSTTLNNYFFGGATTSAQLRGGYNYAIGQYAMANATSTQVVHNFAVGYQALLGSTTAENVGSYNIAIGVEALKRNVTGTNNNALGYQTLTNNTEGTQNNALSERALTGNTTGSYNNAFGSYASASNTTGSYNNAFGENALLNNTGGYYNNAFGRSALFNTTGSNNTAIGHQAGSGISTGYSNIIIGEHTVFNAGITTGSANIGIGSNTFFPSATANNQLNLGNLVFGTVPATSSAATNAIYPRTGALGIATSSPFATLSLHANFGSTNKILFAIGSSTVSATSTLFSVSNTGSTTLYQLPSSLLKTNANGTIIAAVAGVDYAAAGNYATFGFPFTQTTFGSTNANATSTLIGFTNGIYSLASSTIGNGTATGGLTISGNSTTTGNAYFNGSVGIGSTTPIAPLSIHVASTSLAQTLFAVSSTTNDGSLSNLLALSNTGSLTLGGSLYSKGITWIARSAAGNNDFWIGLTYGNGLFVAVGDTNNDRVMTSPDGITWTARSAAGNNDDWIDVTYGNGLFVAVAYSGDRVMTSPDGITWTARSAAGNDDTWTSVTYGNGLFVAVSQGGGDRLMTSPDGITWTARSAAGNDDSWQEITYGNGLFVAVGDTGGSDKVMTSPDGITWTARSAAGNDDGWYGITYGNGLFVAVSASGDRVMTSPDGITWTARSAAGDDDAWVSVTYGNGLFVAISAGGDPVMTSPDGITWTARSAVGNNDGWQEITYGNGLFVAIGSSGDRVMTSGAQEQTGLWALGTSTLGTLFQGGLGVQGNVGIGTTTPYGLLSLHAVATSSTNNTLFTIASSTATYATTTLFSISNTGTTTLGRFGACSGANALTTDSSGNIICGAITGSTGAFAFTQTTNFGTNANSTSTPIWFQNGLQASSTAQLSNVNQYGTLNFATTSTTTLATYRNRSLFTLYTGSANGSMGLGLDALPVNTNLYNTAVGVQALNVNTSGASNTAIGYQAMYNNISGQQNTAVGVGALSGALTSGGDNTAVGMYSLLYEQGTFNVGVGRSAGSTSCCTYATTTGNVFVGALTGNNTLTGADYNVLVGYRAGRGITTGYGNILLGAHVANTAYLSTGSGNIGIGNELYFPDQTTNNQLNLGNLVFGTVPATSSAATGALYPRTGAVGIATSSPFATLSIHANYGSTNQTLFAIGSSTASATSTLFSVSNTGNLFLSGTASTTALIVSGLNAANCDVKADTQGNLSCGTDATGAGGAFPFTQTTFGSTNANATSTLIGFTNGIYALASSTIGNGTATGGLTISGNSTTTGNAYFRQRVGIGTPTPSYTLDVKNVIGTSTPVLVLRNPLGLVSLELRASTSTTNTYIGVDAGLGDTSGNSNTALGYQALYSGGVQGYNTAIGASALYNAGVSASNNTAIGNNALYSNTSGWYNVAIGDAALYTNISGTYNTAVGSALSNMEGGTENVALGSGALNWLVNGTSTVALGTNAGYGGGGGYINQGGTYVGYQSGYGVQDKSDYNTLFGYQAGYSVSTGYANLLVGSHVSTSDVITTGSGNLGFGNELYFPSATANNQLNLGNLVFGTVPATSSAATNAIYPRTGALGIATSSPFATLSLHANFGSTNKILFAIGSSTVSATSTLFSVSNTGNIKVGDGGTAGSISIDAPSTQTVRLNFQQGGTTGSSITYSSSGNSLLFTHPSGQWLSVGGNNGDVTLNGGPACCSANIGGSLTLRGGNSTGTNFSGATTTIAGGAGTGNATPGIIRFMTSSAGASGSTVQSLSEIARFDSTGTFGIGTTSPWAKLSINNYSSGANTAPLFTIASSTGTSATSTLFIVNNVGNVGIGTTSPYAKLSVVGEVVASYFTATSTTATSTFAGGLNVGNGALMYDYSGGLTTIQNLAFGSLNFDTDAGQVSWFDLPVTSNASAGTVQSYTAQIDGTSILTVYAESDGTGNIQKEGIAIGTSTPSASLTVWSATTTSRAIANFVTSASTTVLQINNNGRVGVGTTSPWATFSVDGTVSFANLTLNTGGVTSALCLDANNQITRNTDNETCVASSERYKQNIQTLDSQSSLAAVMALRPVSFEFKNATGTVHYGFIAEEVEQINPLLVSYNDQGLPQSVRYTEVIPLLAQAIQELNLNLATIASTTDAATPSSRAFADNFFEGLFARVTNWLADAGNGIADLFATTIHAENLYANTIHTNELCVGNVCVTEEQFLQIVQNGGVQVSPPQEPPVEQPDDAATLPTDPGAAPSNDIPTEEGSTTGDPEVQSNDSASAPADESATGSESEQPTL